MKLRKKSNEIYSFWRDGVTQSMIQKWLQCPRQARLEYVDGWTAYEQSDAILFGNVVHHVLEHAYCDQVPMPGNIVALIKGYEDILYNDNNEPSAEVLEKNEIIFGQAQALLECYFIKYQKDWDANWLFTERTFKVPYHYSNGDTTFLRGKIDGALVLKNKQNKNCLWFMDHKTTSRPDVDSILTLLPVDFQVWFYLYCSSQLPKFQGKKITGFQYNIIRRPSLRRTQKDNTIDAFIERCRMDVMLRMDYYFTRIKLTITRDEIHHWKETQLDPIMHDMRRWVNSKYTWPKYFSPSALKTVYGLAPMAKAITSNDFTGLYKRSTVFQELEE